MAVSWVQTSYPGEVTGPNSSTTFSSANTSGNLLVACAGYTNSGTVASLSVSDTANGTWSSLSQVQSSGTTIQLFYFLNCAGAANTVTLTTSGASVSYVDFMVSEYAGPTALDQHASAAVTSATATVGPITTTSSTEMLVAGIYSYATVNSLNNGFTSRAQYNGSCIADLAVSSIGSYSAGFNMSGGVASALILASFSGSASAPAAIQRLMLLGSGS